MPPRMKRFKHASSAISECRCIKDTISRAGCHNLIFSHYISISYTASSDLPKVSNTKNSLPRTAPPVDSWSAAIQRHVGSWPKSWIRLRAAILCANGP